MHRILAATLLIALATGCSSILTGSNPSGRIFMHTCTPLTVDLHNTPVVKKSGHGSVIHIQEPISGYGVYTELKTNAIGDIARKYNLKTVYWADLEVFNILGVYRWNRVHLYGE